MMNDFFKDFSGLNQNQKNHTSFKRKTREEYISAHNLTLKMRKEQYNSSSGINFINHHNVIHLGTYNPLGKNLEENFSQINIHNLQINSIHPKKFLILKIISKTILVDSLNFLGEDCNKDVINIAVYDSEKYFNLKGWEELENKIFTEGKYIIIIEPYYTLCTCPCGFDKLRIESPNEIIIFNNKEEMDDFLDKNKPENKSPENYKLLGNLMMKKKLYEKAIFYYEKEFNKNNDKSDDNLEIIVHSNLSEAYFKFGYFTKCINNADYCLNKINELEKVKEEISSSFLKQQKLKALYRKIKGLISLRKFKESYEILFSSDEDDKNKDIIKELLNFGEVKEMINKIKEGKENNLGHFDFKKMIMDEQNNFNLDNYGDYLNPKLEIQFEKEKGIKIVAKEDINLGELLLVEKAIVFKEDREEKGRIGVTNLKKENSNNMPFMMTEIDFFMELGEKVAKYPLDNEKFYYLYDGNNLNEDIVQRKKLLESQEKGEIKLSDEKVKGVIFNNKYQIGRNFIFFNSVSNGIWGYASLLNNDCLPNTAYLGIGNFFVLFSTRNIKKDEEITCRYDNNSLTFKDRQERLLKSWGFKCKCQLCLNQEKINYSDYDSFIKLFYPDSDNNITLEIIDNFKKLIEENQKNFNNYDLANAYLQLETYWSQRKDLDNTKKYSNLVTKYSVGDNYCFQISNIYKLVLCLLGLHNQPEFLNAIKEVELLLTKYTPFTIEEINCFIDDNANQLSKKEKNINMSVKI